MKEKGKEKQTITPFSKGESSCAYAPEEALRYILGMNDAYKRKHSFSVSVSDEWSLYLCRVKRLVKLIKEDVILESSLAPLFKALSVFFNNIEKVCSSSSNKRGSYRSSFRSQLLAIPSGSQISLRAELNNLKASSKYIELFIRSVAIRASKIVGNKLDSLDNKEGEYKHKKPRAAAIKALKDLIEQTLEPYKIYKINPLDNPKIALNNFKNALLESENNVGVNFQKKLKGIILFSKITTDTHKELAKLVKEVVSMELSLQPCEEPEEEFKL